MSTHWAFVLFPQACCSGFLSVQAVIAWEVLLWLSATVSSATAPLTWTSHSYWPPALTPRRPFYTVSQLAGKESRGKKMPLPINFSWVLLSQSISSQLCSVKQTVAIEEHIFKKLHMSMHYHNASLWPVTKRSRHVKRNVSSTWWLQHMSWKKRLEYSVA